MTLLIKQGRRYVRRDGKIAGPMEPSGSFHFPWYDPISDNSYKPNGSVWTNHQVDDDLLTEIEEASEAELIAGEAYQIIGDLALAANLYDHPEVQRALDWFSGFEPGITCKDNASILPWPKEELKADHDVSLHEIAAELATENAELAARVKELEGENAGLREIISKSACALPNGAYIAPSASIEFMSRLPDEILLVTTKAIEDQTDKLTAWDAVCKTRLEESQKAAEFVKSWPRQWQLGPMKRQRFSAYDIQRYINLTADAIAADILAGYKPSGEVRSLEKDSTHA